MKHNCKYVQFNHNTMKIIKITLLLMSAYINTYCTDITDLLNLLSLYGTQQEDITPAFNNYYQDISEGGGYSYLGQLSLVNGVAFFLSPNIVQVDTSSYEFEWLINGVNLTSRANPQIYSFSELQCDGVVLMSLSITDKLSRATFERTQWAYLGYNYILDCDCIECPSLFDVFYDFYPDVEPYFYQSAFSVYDYNNDNLFSTVDFIGLLGEFE